MIEPTISVIATTAMSGATGKTRWLKAGSRHLRIAPATTGRITTCTVSRKRSPVGTLTRVPASAAVRLGVITAASSVEMIVIATDSATSVRARNAMTFDAVPPGQHETRMSPTARGVGRSECLAEAPAQRRHERVLQHNTWEHATTLAPDPAKIFEADRHAHAKHDDRESHGISGR